MLRLVGWHELGHDSRAFDVQVSPDMYQHAIHVIALGVTVISSEILLNTLNE